MYLRLNQVCLLSSMSHMGFSVFSLLISLIMIVRNCVLYLMIIIKSEVWSICHCFGLGHETIACAVCLSIFLYITYPSDSTWCNLNSKLAFTHLSPEQFDIIAKTQMMVIFENRLYIYRYMTGSYLHIYHSYDLSVFSDQLLKWTEANNCARNSAGVCSWL